MSSVPEWVGRYVGIPYQDYGRTQVGCDCWGLVRMIWKEQAGLDLPEFEIDPREGAAIEDTIIANATPWELIVPGKERLFDGVLMTGCFGSGHETKRAAMHVGLVLSPGFLIHTTANTGSAVISRYHDRMVGHSVIGFYRHRALHA